MLVPIPLRFLLSWLFTALLLVVVTVVTVVVTVVAVAVIVASCDVNLDGSFVAFDMIVAADQWHNIILRLHVWYGM